MSWQARALASEARLTTIENTSLPAKASTAALDLKADIAYVDTRVTNLINAAPAALDTLGEIATQLASDESAAGALTTVVASKATITYVDAQLATKINTSALAIVATTGSYADLINKPSAYYLPIATGSVLGGVKQGANVAIAGDGTISVAAPLVQATTSVSGFLTSTDWNTFNNKLSSITSSNVTTALGFTPTNAYDLVFTVTGNPIASEVVYRMLVGRAFTIPANFTGSVSRSLVAATASSVYTVAKNGATIGTITFAATSTTGTFSVQAATSFAILDKLTVTAPASVDATLGDIDFTILGTLN